jgi:hypothetical protein
MHLYWVSIQYYSDNIDSVVFTQLRESPYKIIVYFYGIVPLYYISSIDKQWIKGIDIMWNIKTFKTKQAMTEWLVRNDSKVQWVEIFVNNAYGVEYRKLRII